MGRFNKFHFNCGTYYLIVLHIFTLIILLLLILSRFHFVCSMWLKSKVCTSKAFRNFAEDCKCLYSWQILSHLCSHIYRVLFTRMFLRSWNYLYLCLRLFFTDHMYVSAQFPRVMIHRTRPGVPARDVRSCDRTFSYIDLRNGAKQYFTFYYCEKFSVSQNVFARSI